MGKWLHRLTDIDTAAGTGRCAACGPVVLAYRTVQQRRVPRCPVAVQSQRNSPARHDRVQPHGLRVSEARELVEAAGSCAICGSTADLRLDHCHRQGNVRGVLCNSCNLGLGIFGDDPERLEAAASYLRT